MKGKQHIRKKIQDYFGVLDKQHKENSNKLLTSKVLSSIDTQHVCVYESMHDEINTYEIIQKLEKKGIEVYVPYIISNTEMILVKPHTKKKYIGDIDVFLIPGRAFTAEGKRLGRGKGYYDRFLSQEKYKKSKKIGICYDFQILEDIPTEEHDVPMDIIISNKGIHTNNKPFL